MIIKCSICGIKYKQTYNWGKGTIEVSPHWCDLIEVPFVERVCNNGCDSLIRCRRDGFECREAWTASSESTKLTNREAWNTKETANCSYSWDTTFQENRSYFLDVNIFDNLGGDDVDSSDGFFTINNWTDSDVTQV